MYVWYIYHLSLTDSRIVWKFLKSAFGVGVVAAVAVPKVIAAVGFTTKGVAAGESKSTIYVSSSLFVAGSAAAAAHAAIGNVASGSFFAFMQSIGTMPLLVGTTSLGASVLLVMALCALWSLARLMARLF
jgi:hypothetical protein